jgi:hypothetical protein
MASPMIGPGSTEVRFLTRRNAVPAATGAPSTPTVLLLVPGAAAALAAEAAVTLRSEGTVSVTVVQNVPPPGTLVAGHDLIAIDLSGSDGRCIAFGVEVLAGNPGAEVIFFCEDRASPYVAAAASLGLRSTVVGVGARLWLIQALPALVGAARARRAVRLAESMIPSLPERCEAADLAPASRVAAPPTPLPLPIAETRFREAYVRGVLAATGDRTRAAKQAGIPYRTLCRILQVIETISDGAAGRK